MESSFHKYLSARCMYISLFYHLNDGVLQIDKLVETISNHISKWIDNMLIFSTLRLNRFSWYENC